MRAVLSTMVLAALGLHCAVRADLGFVPNDPDAGDAQTDAGNPGDAMLGDPDGTVTPGCMAGSNDILILGFDLTKPVLYRFDAQTLAFQKLMPLTGCPTGTAFGGKAPFAAALDRNATLWAHFLDYDAQQMKFVYDRMFTIDTSTGACTDTGKALTTSSGKTNEFGLAFVRDPNDMNKDDLFATAVGPNILLDGELDRVALPAMTTTLVGALSNTAHSFLTSTADGKLFTLYRPGNPVWGLRQLDPVNGATITDHPITGLTSSQGPFVFWGGSLYAFGTRRSSRRRSSPRSTRST